MDVRHPVCFVAPVVVFAFIVNYYEENEKSMGSKGNDV